ncbi:MAG: sodium/proline symporter PutP [Pseudomonadota bacterium]
MVDPLYASLALYLLVMLAIGLYGLRTATGNLSEYMLGGRRLHPAVGALSAGASDMSGWMLMGLPGAVFVSGLSAAWIAIGLSVGAYFNYRLVAPRLRVYTELAGDAVTIPDFFAQRFNGKGHALRLFASAVIVVFFTLYTASGLVAGGKLFEAAFGAPYATGVLVTGSAVVAYTLIGGFLAVSLTDFVQGSIMFVALVLVPLVTLGGLDSDLSTAMASFPDGYSELFAGTTLIGVLSTASWGLGYFGQPHIIVRFMAIRSAADMPTARRIGMSWMLIAIAGAVATGYVGAGYVAHHGATLEDPETVFIYLANVLFNPWISGFLLAAVLAAIMSTISSQLLVSSSSLTEDFYRRFLHRKASETTLVRVGRLSVLAVAALAYLLAQDQNNSILGLVANAWAGFGAAFGPTVLLSLFWRDFTGRGALASMVTGAVTVLLWIYVPIDRDGTTLSSILYEIVPGFIAAALAGISVSRLTNPETRDITDRHAAVVARLSPQ